MKLNQFPETLAVVRLGPGSEIPACRVVLDLLGHRDGDRDLGGVCRSQRADQGRPPQAVHAFAVEGPLDFALTGVLVLPARERSIPTRWPPPRNVVRDSRHPAARPRPAEGERAQRTLALGPNSPLREQSEAATEGAAHG